MKVMDHISIASRRLASTVPASIRALSDRAQRLTTAQWIWMGVALAVALLLIALAWPRPLTVEAATIDRGVVTRDVIDEGRTRIHDVFIVSAPVAGELQRIDLEAGDPVIAGQVIATILPADPVLLDARVSAEARASVSAAQAALAAAQADLRLEERNHARVATLHARDLASRAALDAADASLAVARAGVRTRVADLERARIAAGGPARSAQRPTPLRAPVAGRVLRLMQESASVVAPGTPIMEIGDPARLEVIAEFLSQDAVLINAGAPAFVENWGGAEAIPARIFRVEPFGRTEISALGVEEQRVNVIAHLTEAPAVPTLGHGFRVDLRVVVSQQNNALRVPVDALVRDGAGWAVFRIQGGRARLVRVEVGEGGDRFRALLTGLEPGDRVVLFPGDTLADGAAVRVAR
ncbi:MAG: efflux RND transporter periplasmic adaptor subunit [Hyphomonadaceae bacterium]